MISTSENKQRKKRETNVIEGVRIAWLRSLNGRLCAETQFKRSTVEGR